MSFHIQSPWIGGLKVCSWDLGHMTKMATMPIYGKNPSKISRIGGPISMKLYVASGTPAHHNLLK